MADLCGVTAWYALTVLIADLGTTAETVVFTTGGAARIKATDFAFTAFGWGYGVSTAFTGGLVSTAKVGTFTCTAATATAIVTTNQRKFYSSTAWDALFFTLVVFITRPVSRTGYALTLCEATTAVVVTASDLTAFVQGTVGESTTLAWVDAITARGTFER